MTDDRIVYNALKTPDGTIIESRHRHDYVTHTDKNGKGYMIDGGLDYVRSSANGDEEYLTVRIDDGHDKVREACTWGTYGINGDQPLSYKKLCDMDTAHIEVLLETQTRIYPAIKTAFETELEFRSNMSEFAVSNV
jgi:hypothetical protein